MTRKYVWISTTILLLLSFAISGCNEGATEPTPLATAPDGEPSLDPAKDALALAPTGGPSPEEIVDLLFIREEEKLARDVYLVLGEQYEADGLPIFFNIAASEQRHMDAVKRLLDGFGLEDPVGDNGIGEFFSDAIQGLYDQLLQDGQVGLAEGLAVGAFIEEYDILDLEHAIDRAELPEIIKVYEHLRDGSLNHLRAFVPAYEMVSGQAYVPELILQADFDAIMGDIPDHGGNGNQGGNGS